MAILGLSKKTAAFHSVRQMSLIAFPPPRFPGRTSMLMSAQHSFLGRTQRCGIEGAVSLLGTAHFPGSDQNFARARILSVFVANSLCVIICVTARVKVESPTEAPA